MEHTHVQDYSIDGLTVTVTRLSGRVDEFTFKTEADAKEYAATLRVTKH